MRRKVLLGLGVLAVCVAILVPILSRPAAGSSVPVFEVLPGAFMRQITAEGVLKASQATPLSAPIEAQTALKVAWIAPDGALLRKGDTVVRFDPTDFEAMLRDGTGDRSSAENRIGKTAALSDADRDNLKRDSEQAGRELEAARNFQKKDAEIFSRSQRIESEIDETLASERRDYSERVRGIRDGVSQAEQGLLGIDQRKADIKIRQATNGLGALEIRAPHDGILVLSRDWRGEVARVGQSVWAGEPLGELPDLNRMKADVFVLEADAGGLAVGQQASIAVESDASRSVPAKVVRVDAVAKPRIRNVPVQYFGVTLELERTDPEIMKPGTRVQARLRIAEQKDVLSVPLQAIFERSGAKVVYRLGHGGFEARPVEVGASSLGRIVVIHGIEKGDRIALRDPTRTAAPTPAPGSEPAAARPGAS